MMACSLRSPTSPARMTDQPAYGGRPTACWPSAKARLETAQNPAKALAWALWNRVPLLALLHQLSPNDSPVYQAVLQAAGAEG